MLATFLNSHRASGKFTHTGLDPMMGKYYIDETELDEFYKLYNTALKKNEKLALTECHEQHGPILIDIDMRFHREDGIERRYNENDIKNIIKLYNDEIQKYFDCEETALRSYVFEKSVPIEVNGNVKDGIHIMYPNIISIPEVQFEIRDNVISQCKKTKIFERLCLKNKLEDAIDESVIKKNNWFLYGGSKPEQEAYKLTHIYDGNLNETDLPLHESLTRNLSIRGHKDPTNVKIKLNPKYVTIEKVPSQTVITSLNQLETVKELVGLLSDERADSYQMWLELGFCLHNIDPQGSLLETWIQFSKRSDKFQEGNCERNWSKFKRDGLTVGSLYRWAKIDSPEAYKEMKRNEVDSALKVSLSNTNYDVAFVLYEMHKYEYVCASIQKNVWYEFKNHRWHELDKGLNLRKRISSELADEYRRLSSLYNAESIKDDIDAAYRKQMEDKIEQAERLIRSCKTTTFKDKVMTECSELFYDSTFINKLDSKPNLLGFQNGVYDLDQFIFREGKPDDYIGNTTGIDYIEYQGDDEKVKAFKRVWKQIFPDNDERKYMLTVISSFLHGKVSGHFFMWTGTGANGKSTVVDLIEASFGSYTGKLPVSILTQKRSSAGQATPELVRTKGKRFVSMQEPEGGDRINVGVMKEYTGGDKLQGRGLFKDTVEWTNQCKYVLMCNDLPHIPSTDGGTWRRIRPVYFKAKFLDDPDPDPKLFQWKKDYDLKENLVNMAEPFMTMLIGQYKKEKPYKSSNHIKEPESVIKFTKKYEAESNTFLEYCNENIIRTENQSDKLHINDIYTHFKIWYQDGYSSKAQPKKVLIEFMNSQFTYRKNYYFGIKWNAVEDEEDL